MFAQTLPKETAAHFVIETQQFLHRVVRINLYLKEPSKRAKSAMAYSFDGSQCYENVFISDIHLGTRGCQAAKLLEFLRTVSCKKLFLVGDVIDGWQLKKLVYMKCL